MTITGTPDTGYARSDEPPVPAISAVGGPVWVGWREGIRTRAAELEALCEWVRQESKQPNREVLATAIHQHLDAAKAAAQSDRPSLNHPLRILRNASLVEHATNYLDAAEASILAIAPADYVLGQMPGLLKHVQCHLRADDPRRQEFDRIARMVGIRDPDHPLLPPIKASTPSEQEAVIDHERRKISTIVRDASTEALREHVRLRSFRDIVVGTAVFMTLLALGIAIAGMVKPTLIPICFAPEESNAAVRVVCPTGESQPFPYTGDQAQQNQPDIDDVIAKTVNPADLLVIGLVGLTAAAVAAAAAIRGIQGSSERYGLPVALAALKLPTGAITAILGLLLIRGQFVPGLGALDTPGQIVAWALLFGYGQQLFTRLVDQQGQTVLNRVRGADKPEAVQTAA